MGEPSLWNMAMSGQLVPIEDVSTPHGRAVPLELRAIVLKTEIADSVSTPHGIAVPLEPEVYNLDGTFPL